MIFVTVGTQKFQMNRLLMAVDQLVEKGVITDQVVMQTGHSDYQPKHAKYQDFFEKREMERLIEKCDLLICHAGVGSILCGIRNKKKVISMARLKAYKEHIDDHQIEIVKAFEQAGYLRRLKELEELEGLMSEMADWKPETFQSNTGNFLEILEEVIESK